jgi:prepilin-type N-terminal cleavage/methylation domain-containing protein
MNPGRKRTHRQATETGFTLIEVMMAMVILSVGLFSVVQLQVISVRGGAYARERIEAMEIATGVMEEMRTQNLEWVENMKLKTFAPTTTVYPPALFPMAPIPAACTPLPIAGLQSVQTYLHDPATGNRNIIATSAAPGDALLINVHGQTAAAAGLSGERAIYRVHYISHFVPSSTQDIPTDACCGASPPCDFPRSCPQLIRVTVIVSWDNKDVGVQDYDWANWWDNGGDNFWDRHMVTVTFYMFRRRTW